ncbi:MAG: hypothetical protein AB7N76_05725 [Planctomycetota bacterium]
MANEQQEGRWLEVMRERWFGQARTFVERVLRPARRRDVIPEVRRRTMPCELFLTMGWQSVKLFPSGPIDEFCFFQRSGVSLAHDVEFLARLDREDEGSEDYKPYGLFRLEKRHAERLPVLEQQGDLWATLADVYGLSALPNVHAMASRRFDAFDPRYESRAAGLNAIDPPKSAKAFVRAARRHFSYADVLEILRAEMSSAEKIAWLEEAFETPPAPGEVVHRYYLDRGKQAWLVRHHWSEGKRLFRAQTNEDALAFCLASGNFSRPAIAREQAAERRAAA